jgi:hypothetical protein
MRKGKLSWIRIANLFEPLWECGIQIASSHKNRAGTKVEFTVLFKRKTHRLDEKVWQNSLQTVIVLNRPPKILLVERHHVWEKLFLQERIGNLCSCVAHKLRLRAMIALIWVLHNDVAHRLWLGPMIALIWVLHNDVAHKYELSFN